MEEFVNERSPLVEDPNVKVGEALKIIRDCDWDCKEASRIIVDDLLSKAVYCVAFELERANAIERLERFLVKLVQKEVDGKFTAAPQIYDDIFVVFSELFKSVNQKAMPKEPDDTLTEPGPMLLSGAASASRPPHSAQPAAQ